MTEPNTRRANRLLALGAASGLLLAIAGLFISPEAQLPANVVAAVDQVMISKADLSARLQMQSQANPAALISPQQVLQQLLDETLLLNRANELQLSHNSASVRKAMVQEMLQQIQAQAVTSTPTAAELQAFYQANRHYFAQPGQLHVRQLAFKKSSSDAANRARQAETALRSGAEWATVASTLSEGDSNVPPDQLMPASRLTRYLGSAVVDQLAQLPAGGISPVLGTAEDYKLFLVVENLPGYTPPLADIEQQVGIEYQRRAAAQALADYITTLRENSRITLDHHYLTQLQTGNAGQQDQ